MLPTKQTIVTPRPLPRGFTFVELIAVMVVLGILAVALVPNWSGTEMSLQFEAQRVLNDIRYTQAMSMTSGQRYRWVRVSSNSYSVLNETGTAVLLPNGATVASFGANVSFGSFTNLPNNLIAFNSFGVPYVDTGIPGTALASTASIAISAGGDTFTIQISPQTGFGAMS